MTLIRIGDRLLNLDHVVSAEYVVEGMSSPTQRLNVDMFNGRILGFDGQEAQRLMQVLVDQCVCSVEPKWPSKFKSKFTPEEGEK